MCPYPILSSRRVGKPRGIRGISLGNPKKGFKFSQEPVGEYKERRTRLSPRSNPRTWGCSGLGTRSGRVCEEKGGNEGGCLATLSILLALDNALYVISLTREGEKGYSRKDASVLCAEGMYNKPVVRGMILEGSLISCGRVASTASIRSINQRSTKHRCEKRKFRHHAELQDW